MAVTATKKNRIRERLAAKSYSQLPLCRKAMLWLEARLGAGVGAPLTSQDSKALHTFLHACELYGCGDDDAREGGLAAMAGAVLSMQRKTRWIAREAIPHVLDWSDRQQIWFRLMQCGRSIDVVMNDGFDALVEHEDDCSVFGPSGAYGPCSCGARS